MKHNLVALMPMRHSSERVPGKNYRAFGVGRPLYQHVLDVLLSCSASEKVVILPDADGHVGGVEVDDGKSKTVLDSAYATSEVGKDGRAQAVPASSGGA